MKNKRLKIAKKIKIIKMMNNQQNKIKIRKKMKTYWTIKNYKIKLPNNRIHPNHKAHHHKQHLNKIHPRNKNKINNKNMKI